MSRYGPNGELFQCSGCHMFNYITGYKINRLGIRLKTCLRCVAREKTPKRVEGRKAQAQKRSPPPAACAPAPAADVAEADLAAALEVLLN
jgi:hypothetical protein